MSRTINLMIRDDGVATIYDDTYDITIHCENEEEQHKVVELLKSIPSAQPEIISCKDCKHGVHAGCGNTYLCVVSPEDRLEHKCDFWCAYAERRTDD